MKLLDLFCGAGGAATGYHQAGFTEIIGIDNKDQKGYPFTFIKMDALLLLSGLITDSFCYTPLGDLLSLNDFQVIHASPPCQAYTTQGRNNPNHSKLIEPIRYLLQQTSLPYIIENVAQAPLINPLLLCGSMFGLGVRRHRKFESNIHLTNALKCQHKGQDIRAYYGAWGREAFRAKKSGNKDTLRGTIEQAPADMGINWMNWNELREAIPPAYTKFIGLQLIDRLSLK